MTRSGVPHHHRHARPRGGRRGEAGLVRTLLGAVFLLGVVMVAALVVLTVKVTMDPDLGAAPRGPGHGAVEADIAAYAARSLAPLLAPGHLHQTVSLSEQDVTAELLAHVPSRGPFRDPQARIRDGHLVVNGLTTFGPIGVVGVGHVGLTVVTGLDGSPDIAVRIDQIDAGTLTLPGSLRSAIADRISTVVNLNNLFGSRPELRALRQYLECVAIHDDAVVVGFHASGAPPDPATCH